MSGIKPDYSHKIAGKVAAVALVLALAFMACFASSSIAYAEESSSDDSASVEAPIKPRPKVEITSGVVTLEPAENNAILDEVIPLAAFDLEPCFIHLLMLAGIAVTVSYTFFAYKRTSKQVQIVDKKTADLMGGMLPSSESAGISLSMPVSAPVVADQ